MILLLVIVLITSVIAITFFELLSAQAKELLNDENHIIELAEGDLTLKVRRHSVKGWIARFLEKMRYLEGRKEALSSARHVHPEFVEGQDVKIKFFTFKITHAGLNARESNWFGCKLLVRILLFLFKKLLWLLINNWVPSLAGPLWYCSHSLKTFIFKHGLSLKSHTNISFFNSWKSKLVHLIG